MTDIFSKSLVEIRDALAAGEIKAEQAVQACLERIEKTEPEIGALISIQAEQALAQAREMDATGPDANKPLWGVPLILKDLLCTKGVETTCASRILDGFKPPYNATVVEKLQDAGAILIAKANMDEFAMGSSTENSAYKVTRNPWALDRVPGGSSGGSAATVAAKQCFGALGTDTGGSIRLPASFCGIVGLKPTYGRVSRYGLIAYGSSLDQIGPMTRTVADTAAMLQVIAGHDPKDSTSANMAVDDYVAAAKPSTDLKGLRIGMPEEYWGEGVSAEVREQCEAALDKARDLGAVPVPVKLPHTEYAIAAYYIIAMAEASSNLSRFDGIRYGHSDRSQTELMDLYRQSRTQGFGAEVQRRIITGTYVLSSGYYDAYYRKAAKVRRLIRQDFINAYEKCDIICGPACPTTAFELGKGAKDPLQMYLMDVFTISLNLAGLPGMSLPVGLGTESRMPVGLQIFGPAFSETTMLGFAATLEANLAELPEPAAL